MMVTYKNCIDFINMKLETELVTDINFQVEDSHIPQVPVEPTYSSVRKFFIRINNRRKLMNSYNGGTGIIRSLICLIGLILAFLCRYELFDFF